MFCPKCGAPTTEWANFCERCGYKLVNRNEAFQQSVQHEETLQYNQQKRDPSLQKEHTRRVQINIDSFFGNMFSNYITVMTTQYIRFNGRVSLIQFWQFNIVATIVIWGCTLLGSALSEVWENDLMYIAWIAHLLPILGMFVRRLHDCNMQGWWILSQAIPILELIIILKVMFWPGDDGPNRFGDVPGPLT